MNNSSLHKVPDETNWMRRILLAIQVFCFVQNALLCQWTIQHENLFKDFSNFSYSYARDGYWMMAAIVGDSVLIYDTQDEGIKWNRHTTYLSSTAGASPGKIEFINDSTGWAIQWDGIYRMNAGSQTWELVLSGKEPTFTTSEIYPLSKDTVYLIGWIILKTTNGGLNWDTISPDNYLYLRSPCFLSADTLIIGGFKCIYQTFDGGKSWIEIKIPEFDSFSNIVFLNDSTGYFLATDGSEKSFICKTTLAFNDWSVLTQENTPNKILSFKFITPDTVFSFIQDFFGVRLMRSCDGGRTWENTNGSRLSSLCDYNLFRGAEDVLYILGTSTRVGGRWVVPFHHIVLKSEDHGRNWTQLQYSFPGFQDVFFVNHDTGFVLGNFWLNHAYSNGAVFRTYNAGNTWEHVMNGFLTSCDFSNDTNGFIISRNRCAIYQSLDEGANWFWNDSPYRILNSCAIRDLFFVNNQIGYLLNSEYEVFKTLDNANSWIKMYQFDSCEINSVYFGNSRPEWTNSAHLSWEKINSGTTLPLKKITFADSKTGWIWGGYTDEYGIHPVLLKTTDGGESWDETSGLNFLINDLFFKDTVQGWAVGIDTTGQGIILETNDGGQCWVVQMDSLDGALHAIHFKDGKGWAVGDHGLILNAIDTSFVPLIGSGLHADSESTQQDTVIQVYYGWAVGENGLIIKMVDSSYSVPVDTTNTIISEGYWEENKARYRLYNYPNPFSFETTINYELSQKNDIELAVYDLAGRKVCRLYNGLKEAGRYHYTWNATGMKPGIYFCELKAGNVRVIEKVIILK